ncbi:Short-chain dehydrogenase/reductase ATR10 [Colletotrichum siamense]|uniref:Short-chain dehydrogenase/reductase ATR10 n=1 Tax=Colletotrichum siamense TaxID=690259 RepID=A0A9P5BPX3_COLSI|nr:Short-chain dehydrogenase/reductase ATR10 [Colletotrichum siamense]KAF4842542.1 Short-chain dehydrogenase/reductase ATR10 [Colletotrichum siamense]
MESPTVALITGANGGIGRAVAEILAADHHYYVVIGSRSLAAGQYVAESLKCRGLLASAVQLDLTVDADILAAAAYISETFGKLDVLVNNAAVHFDMTYSLSVREQWTSTFATNVVGTAVLTDKLLSLLRKSEFPRIVFVSSTKGSMGAALDTTLAFQDLAFNPDDASKAAINMLTVGYAKVLKDVGGVANAVCPGLVDTKMTASMGEEILASHGAASPKLGARRIVEMATLEKGSGVSATFSSRNGTIPW